MDKNISVGYCDFRSSGPLLASVWKDKRIIHFLSTIHVAQASSPVTVQRREKDGICVLVKVETATKSIIQR